MLRKWEKEPRKNKEKIFPVLRRAEDGENLLARTGGSRLKNEIGLWR